ncbi:hypothetical protein J6590_052522 [Homalodisca vitripennis]|nr:hypothetical protein J6590_052522 [Homalodisca vitripennis]
MKHLILKHYGVQYSNAMLKFLGQDTLLALQCLVFSFMMKTYATEKMACAKEMAPCTPDNETGIHPPCCPPAECFKIVIDVAGRPRSERYKCYTTPADMPPPPKTYYMNDKKKDNLLRYKYIHFPASCYACKNIVDSYELAVGAVGGDLRLLHDLLCAWARIRFNEGYSGRVLARDLRVSWVYELWKPELIMKMKRNGR